MIFLLVLLFASSLHSMGEKLTLAPNGNIITFEGRQCNLGSISKRSISAFSRPVVSCVFYYDFYFANRLYTRTYMVHGMQQRATLKDMFKPKNKRPINIRIHEIEATTCSCE